MYKNVFFSLLKSKKRRAFHVLFLFSAFANFVGKHCDQIVNHDTTRLIFSNFSVEK